MSLRVGCLIRHQSVRLPSVLWTNERFGSLRHKNQPHWCWCHIEHEQAKRYNTWRDSSRIHAPYHSDYSRINTIKTSVTSGDKGLLFTRKDICFLAVIISSLEEGRPPLTWLPRLAGWENVSPSTKVSFQCQIRILTPLTSRPRTTYAGSQMARKLFNRGLG